MLNRANRRSTIFEKVADYEAFERILFNAVAKFKIELFSYCGMPKHLHIVVRPIDDGEMSRFAQWLTLTQPHGYHAHHHSAGEGHLYQGRFKSFPVQDDGPFLDSHRLVRRRGWKRLPVNAIWNPPCDLAEGLGKCRLENEKGDEKSVIYTVLSSGFRSSSKLRQQHIGFY